MPRRENQKLKILYLLDILRSRSDAEHPLSAARLIELLEERGIAAERKSIYNDIEELRRYGADILRIGGKTGGFFLASRTFELPELKLLVDAVQSSRFITEKKAAGLIQKIESLASVYDAAQLSRQVYVSGRVRTMNEQVYYNIDALHAAIHAGRRIDFLYFELTADFSGTERFKKRYRHGGERYTVSPFALCRENENYYLIGYDASDQTLKNYRVDKMEGIRLLPAAREGGEAFAAFSPAGFTKQRFGMFGGRTEKVRLYFDAGLAGVAADRFGKDAFLIPEGEDGFSLTAEVQISPQFFSWVFGLSGGVKILSPPEVAAAYADMLRAGLAACDPDDREKTTGGESPAGQGVST
ncbi:MAG: helix-turn-helix transcriptional regulator [Candidatus Howiella sp.]|jgi:predicted DNA-binding transcriptional regulator YafY